MTREELVKAVKKIKAETEEDMYYLAWDLADSTHGQILSEEGDGDVTFYGEDFVVTFRIVLKDEWFYCFR